MCKPSISCVVVVTAKIYITTTLVAATRGIGYPTRPIKISKLHCRLKALLHCAISRAYLATAKNVAKPVAETVAESRIKFSQ